MSRTCMNCGYVLLDDNSGLCPCCGESSFNTNYSADFKQFLNKPITNIRNIEELFMEIKIEANRKIKLLKSL